MSGESAKGIKLRIKSLENTMQITKAMEMVASSKLRRAQERVEKSRPYFHILYETLTDIADATKDFSSPFLKEKTGDIKSVCYIVIGGDRGLAGSYNSNVFRLVMGETAGKDTVIFPIGKKAVEFFRHRNFKLMSEMYAEAADVTIGDCFSMAKIICKEFQEGRFDAIYVAYTNFISVLNQSPNSLMLLPLGYSKDESAEYKPREGGSVIYEPGGEAVFNTIVPEYLGGLIYGALCESVSSELAARRTAMDAATNNASDMIDDLSLKYNKVRQGAITQEITEIIAGSEE